MAQGNGCFKSNCEFYQESPQRCLHRADTVSKSSGYPLCPFHPDSILRKQYKENLKIEEERRLKKEQELKELAEKIRIKEEEAKNKKPSGNQWNPWTGNNSFVKSFTNP